MIDVMPPILHQCLLSTLSVVSIIEEDPEDLYD
jgi:hypothetical protein